MSAAIQAHIGHWRLWSLGFRLHIPVHLRAMFAAIEAQVHLSDASTGGHDI